MRRPEAVLIGLLALALILAVVLGRQAAPDQRMQDRRTSTLATGPAGASALAETLRRLGVPVMPRRVAFFNFDVAPAERARVLVALLNLPTPPTSPEVAAIVDLVRRGGHILLAGSTGVESCFGLGLRRTARSDRGTDTTGAAGEFPAIEWVFQRLHRAGDDSVARTERCGAVAWVRVDTLLRAGSDDAMALRMRFGGGGTATLVADPGWLTNRSLRDTDAGLVVIPWFLASRPARVIVDEYHQGFGRGGSLMGAAWRWMWTSPPGWAMLQLAAAVLLGLIAMSVRFGPALDVVERRRRSPLEHLEALATGLERAEGRGTAVRLLVLGLKRRLHRAGGAHRGGEQDSELWLASLALAARTADAGTAVRRLGNLTRQRGGDEQVLDAANAVEDVWEALGPERTRTPS